MVILVELAQFKLRSGMNVLVLLRFDFDSAALSSTAIVHRQRVRGQGSGAAGVQQPGQCPYIPWSVQHSHRVLQVRREGTLTSSGGSMK